MSAREQENDPNTATTGQLGGTRRRRMVPLATLGAVVIVLLFLLSGFPGLSPIGSASAPIHSAIHRAPVTAAPVALAGTPTLTLSSLHGTVHSTVNATGSGFPAGILLNLSWGSASPGGLRISPMACGVGQGNLVGSSINTSTSGGFDCSFLVPGATPGGYLVSASDGSTSSAVASAGYTVDWFPTEVVANSRFDASVSQPLPALALRSCGVALTSGACSVTGSTLTPYLNASNDPVLNHTSTGVLALAYTSYTSGTAPCASAVPYSLSNIAVQTSTNDGTTWTAPKYLGNPVCSTPVAPNRYPSAWEPAITSLGDGTLVLAYVEYNSTSPSFPPFYNLSSSSLSRLVVTESSNGGGTWTTPTVVNVSNPDPSLTVPFPPVRPSITAFGKTIYLTWMSLGRTISPTVTSHVAMIVSTTGGKSWSPTLTLGAATSNSANPNVLVTPAGRLFVAYVTGISYSFSTGNAVSGNVVVGTSTANGTGMTTATVRSFVTANQTFGPFFHPDPVLSWNRFGVLDVAFIGGQGAIGGSATGLYFYTSLNNASSFAQSFTGTGAFFNPSTVRVGYPNASRILTLAMTPMGTATRGNVFLVATVFNGTACVGGHCGLEMQIAVNTSNNGTSWSKPIILNGHVMPNGTNGSWRPFLAGEYQSAIYYPSPSGPGHLLYAGTNSSCPSWVLYPKSAVAQCGTFIGSGGAATTLWGTTTVTIAQNYTGATATETFSPSGLPWDGKWYLTLMGNSLIANGSTNLTVSGIPTNLPLLFNVTGSGQYNSSFQFRFESSSVTSPVVFTSSGSVAEKFSAWVPLTIKVNPTSLLGQNCQTPYGCSPSYFSPPAYFGDLSSGCITPGSYYGYCTIGCVGYMLDYYNYPYNSNYFTYFGFEYEYVGCADSYVSHNASGQPGVALPSGRTVYVQAGAPYGLNITHWNPLDALCGQGNPPALPPPNPSSTYSYFEDYCFSIYIAQLNVFSWFGTGPGNTTSQQSNITVSPTGPVTETVNFGLIGECSGQYAEYFASSYGGGSWSGRAYNNTICSKLGGNNTGPPIYVPLQVQETGLPSGVTWGLTLTSGNATVVGNTSSSSTTFNDLVLGNTYDVSVDTIPTGTPGVYWVGTTNATVTMPKFQPLIVTFTKRSLAGLSFAAKVGEQGLPTGAGWSFYVANSTANVTQSMPPGWLNAVPVPVVLSGGVSYTLNGSPVYSTNGTAYYVEALNLTFASINSTSSEVMPGSSIDIIGAAAIMLIYTPVYWLTVYADQGGTATPSSHWVASGTSVTLTATVASSKYQFASWTGFGNGSKSGPALTITITPTGPVTEIANFRPTPPITYNITVQATGLSAGTTYGLSLGSQTFSGNASFVITNVSGGSYVLAAPMVYSAPIANTRWVASGLTTTNGAVTGPVTIASDLTVTIAYQVQYLLVATSTSGGTIGGLGSSPWYDPDAQVALTAMPNPGPPGVGYHFVSWNGSGIGSATGTTAAISVTMSGPVSEIAEFALNPIPPPRTYILTLTETGLPTGVSWNVTLGSIGNSSTTGTMEITRLNGTYTVSVPIVYGASGVRYVPTPSTQPTPVTTNASVSVTFATQYLVSVAVSGGGNATPSTEWVADGAQVTLTAVANPSWVFVAWNGTTNSPNATLSLVVSGGPVSESATFVPNYPHKTTTDVLAGAPIAFGLLAVLLVVGLVVALLLSRRRRGGTQAQWEPEASEPMPAEEPGPETR